MEMAHYMNCGTDDERSDFFAFNDYSWCNPNTFKGAGWDQKVKNFTGFGLPIFLSEYGCIEPGPRTFEEIESIYSSEMTGVYSGGLVYEYTAEGENEKYGLVKVQSSTKVNENPDFKALKKAFASTKSPSGDGGYESKSAASKCPSKSSNWNVTSDALPAIPKKALEVRFPPNPPTLFQRLMKLTFAVHDSRCWQGTRFERSWFADFWR